MVVKRLPGVLLSSKRNGERQCQPAQCAERTETMTVISTLQCVNGRLLVLRLAVGTRDRSWAADLVYRRVQPDAAS